MQLGAYTGQNTAFAVTTFLLPSDTTGHVEFRYAAADSAGAGDAGAYIDDVTVLTTVQWDIVCSDVLSCPN